MDCSRVWRAPRARYQPTPMIPKLRARRGKFAPLRRTFSLVPGPGSLLPPPMILPSPNRAPAVWPPTPYAFRTGFRARHGAGSTGMGEDRRRCRALIAKREKRAAAAGVHLSARIARGAAFRGNRTRDPRRIRWSSSAARRPGKTTQLPKICLRPVAASATSSGTRSRGVSPRAVATRIAHELAACRRGRRLQSALHRPHASRCVHQADDRWHPARRDARRSRARGLRHDHCRRGARAQSQHRFPTGLSQAAAATASRSQGHHHVGHARCQPFFAAFRHSGGARARDRSVGSHVSGRCPLPPLRDGMEIGSTDGAREADDEEELEEAIVSADLWRSGPGDILVFLPGEREIARRPTRCGTARRPHARELEILPLSRGSRLPSSNACSHREPAIARAGDQCRGTSLTVPGIRRDRFRSRAREAPQLATRPLLQIEKISQAAGEPAGRTLRPRRTASACACTATGISPASRIHGPRDPAPSVILRRMAALDLPEVAAFPFLEAPGSRAIADGY